MPGTEVVSAARAATPVASGPDLSAFVPLFREIGDLKRVRSAGREGSIATRLFLQAWAALVAGRAAEEVAFNITAAAIAAARLGDLDAVSMAGLGLEPPVATAVLAAGFDDLANDLDAALRAKLRAHLPGLALKGGAPPFARALAEQPRAGVTCPGRARIVLQPPENHAEHCLAVAVFGVVLSPGYGADPATVFLAALAHHLHNAAMPDSGFTGEMLLVPHLEPAMRHATGVALAELDDPLRAAVEAARGILPDADTPEGCAFHAADVLDRVLEIDQHLAAARLTMDTVLGDMALVHDGPVKPFHDRVLREAGLP